MKKYLKWMGIAFLAVVVYIVLPKEETETNTDSESEADADAGSETGLDWKIEQNKDDFGDATGEVSLVHYSKGTVSSSYDDKSCSVKWSFKKDKYGSPNLCFQVTWEGRDKPIE